MNPRHRASVLLLQAAPYLLFLLVVIVFGALSPRFLSLVNARNILIQAAWIGIVSIGMTWVLIAAEIDLSVGATMYMSGCVLGLFAHGADAVTSLGLAALVGIAIGALNGLLVAGLRVSSFIATLSMLFILRGFATMLSQTRTVYLSDSITSLNRISIVGVPFAIVAVLLVALVGWLALGQTPFGRQVTAVGASREAAAKAGLPARRLVFACFVISGLLAALGGFVSLTQIGAIVNSYGTQAEFSAVAAAVLGGTSLFGGRGGVLGTLFGAVLIQTVYNGLVIVDADPYLYPLVTAAIIFIAVAVDGLRTRLLDRLQRRYIRPWEMA